MGAWLLALVLAAGPAVAEEPAQRIGKPLELGELRLQEVYANDFSGADEVGFESAFVIDSQRKSLPPAAAEWIAEGAGGAEICEGRLHVAPVAFAACGETVDRSAAEPSHMVVWNRHRFPADMMFEFTINHHGSDDGLTLVIFAAEGIDGQDVFDLDLPPREGVYRNYHGDQLKNYTVSYWSRNKKPGLVKRGEQYTNRMRKNPGMHKQSNEYSRTDKCSDCDYHVRILKSGGLIAVEINGEVVNQVIDPDPLGDGFIGLRNMMGVDRVSYNDFRVWSVK